MYALLLAIHSWVRWLVILAGVYAVLDAARQVPAPMADTAGRTTAPPQPPSVALQAVSARRLSGLLFTTVIDVQFLLGILLYGFFSPITTAAMTHFGSAMGNDVARFWAVEHPIGMIAALVLAHIGRARARRAAPGVRRPGLLFYVLALVIVLVAIPWPSRPYGRPLLRV